MINIETLKYDDKGLIPAIVLDAEDKKVLMLAYMNKESLALSIEKNLTCFYSRSRQSLWLKGETSGNYQHIVKIVTDCDRDSLLVYVDKEGPACHTGAESCFYETLYENEERVGEKDGGGGKGQDQDQAKDLVQAQVQGKEEEGGQDSFLDKLYDLVIGRKEKPLENSYTSYLFREGRDKILKKIGEEATEVVIAAKGDDKGESIYELADLVYHSLVLMVDMDIKIADILAELEGRHKL